MTIYQFCDSLNQALEKEAANFDGDIQLVFFHPEFKFKDKDDQVVFVFDDDGNPIGIHPTSSLFGVSMKTKN